MERRRTKERERKGMGKKLQRKSNSSVYKSTPFLFTCTQADQFSPIIINSCKGHQKINGQREATHFYINHNRAYKIPFQHLHLTTLTYFVQERFPLIILFSPVYIYIYIYFISNTNIFHIKL